MQVTVLLLVFVALVCTPLTRAEQEANVALAGNKSSEQAELLPQENQTLNARQSRFLRRVFPNVYIHSSLGRVASDIDDVEDYDMEQLERAVRKQQRVRRRKVLGSSQSLRTKRKGSKKKTKKSSKKGKRKTKRKNSKRKTSKGKKPRRPKKPVKPLNDDASEDNYDEEIHKLQREPGQPISVMIVEQDF